MDSIGRSDYGPFKDHVHDIFKSRASTPRSSHKSTTSSLGWRRGDQFSKRLLRAATLDALSPP